MPRPVAKPGGKRAGRRPPARPLLSLAMIVRNEAAGLARCLDSIVNHVDEIVVVDTGSTDETRAIARRYTSVVIEYPWQDNFAESRQRAFNAATGQWILWLDGDDVVLDAVALRTACEQAPADVGALSCRYITGRDTLGRVTQEAWRERVVRAGTHLWQGRAHEVLVPQTGLQHIRSEALTVEHKGKPARGFGGLERNIKLLSLELASQETPDPRTLFYLARDTMLCGRAAEALEYFARYLAVATWPPERYTAYLMVAQLQLQACNFSAARDALLDAQATLPALKDAYFALAELAYYQDNWQQVVHWCRAGMACAPEAVSLFGNPRAMQADWLIFYTVALWRLGRRDEARMWTERALR